MREIELKKNDKERIRADCFGTVPTLGSAGAGGLVEPSQSVWPGGSISKSS